MEVPTGQENQSINFKDYKIIIVVFGTRQYNNKREFHSFMVEYIKRFDEPILFLSGAASSGADRFIIDWCKKFKYPCHEMPADWDKHAKAAGYIRNVAMSDIATNGVAFFDGTSPGTNHMIENCEGKLQSLKIVKVKL